MKWTRFVHFVLLFSVSTWVNPLPAQPPANGHPSAPKAEADERPFVRFYGILKPTIIVGNGLESFGNPNYVAVTAAANPLFLNNPDAVALTFQAQQTRVGLAVGESSPARGVIELDFVDFSKSSPAQGTGLRVRQAFVEWTVREGHKLTLGQLWDMFAPLNTHTYDLVGAMFQAGNAGFMRHQLIYTGMFGAFEGVLALGLTNQNLTASLNNIEYGRVPTMVARGSYRPDKTVWFGAAVMATRVTFDATRPTERTTTAAGGNLFADLTFASVNLRFEAYGGQNLNNLGMLVLGHGNATADIREVGGYTSLRANLTNTHALLLIAGGAFVLNPNDMALGYTPGTPASGDSTAVGPLRASGNGPGIERNIGFRVGHSYNAWKGLSVVTEPFFFLTRHKLDPAAGVDEDRLGWGVQVGGLYVF